jgi:hypothetical protein
MVNGVVAEPVLFSESMDLNETAPLQPLLGDHGEEA